MNWSVRLGQLRNYHRLFGQTVPSLTPNKTLRQQLRGTLLWDDVIITRKEN